MSFYGIVNFRTDVKVPTVPKEEEGRGPVSIWDLVFVHEITLRCL